MLDNTFWNDPDFDNIEELEPLAFYIYLMSNNSANSIGLYRFSKRQAVTDARLMPDKIEEYLKLLSGMEEPKIMYDHETKWIWVMGSFSRNYKAIKNKSIAKNVHKQIWEISQCCCPLYPHFEKKYSKLISLVAQQCDTIIGKGIGIEKDIVLKDDINRDSYISVFDSFRKLYPGTKRGNETEFENFVLKQENWQKILPELEALLKTQIEAKALLQEAKEFVPQWKNLKTWINNKGWEEEIAEPMKKPFRSRFDEK